jgi:hypothetical protein
LSVDVEESLESDIYPLEVGNSWTYLFTALENEVLDRVDTVFVEIIGTEVIELQGRSLEVFQEKRTRSSSRSEPLVLLLRHEKDGLYRYFKGNRQYPPWRQQRIKSPAVVGASWIIAFEDYGYVLTFESLDASFVTPAGTFNAYQASQGEEGGWRSHAYYSPGIGYVGSEGEGVIDSGTYTTREVLLDYVLK